MYMDTGISTRMYILYVQSVLQMEIQWNLSITDTLGPEKQFFIWRFPLFRGYFTCVTIYLDPQKQSVIERFPLFRGYFTCVTIYLDPQKESVIERFPLLGEFVMRGSAVPTYTQKRQNC